MIRYEDNKYPYFIIQERNYACRIIGIVLLPYYVNCEARGNDIKLENFNQIVNIQPRRITLIMDNNWSRMNTVELNDAQYRLIERIRTGAYL